jgi:hypothetical protein
MDPALIQVESVKKPWSNKVAQGHTKKGPCPSGGCTVEDLLAEAALADADFKLLFDHFVWKKPCDVNAYELWGKAKEANGKTNKTNQVGRVIMEKKNRMVTTYGKLKGRPRIEQKCLTKYKIRATKVKPRVSPGRYINDVVRGTIAFKNCKDMLGMMNYIESMENKNIADLNFKYRVVRVKQIYEPKGFLLYGDVKLNIQIQTANVTHNCELQLNHLEMLKAKGTTAGHGAYEAWRDMEDEHWKDKDAPLPKKIGDMTGEYQRKAKEIVRMSQGAYANAAKALDKDKNYKAVQEKIDKWTVEIEKKRSNGPFKKFYDTP